jgi:hypothetical protein
MPFILSIAYKPTADSPIRLLINNYDTKEIAQMMLITQCERIISNRRNEISEALVYVDQFCLDYQIHCYDVVLRKLKIEITYQIYDQKQHLVSVPCSRFNKI